MSESNYGTTLINSKEEYERDAAEVKLVLSFGVKLSKDGDQWSCLLGNNLQEGHATFSRSPIGAVEKMRAYIYTGQVLKETEQGNSKMEDASRSKILADEALTKISEKLG